MTHTIPVTTEIPAERIRALLCAAFEGGVGYWAQIAGYGYPPGTVADDWRSSCSDSATTPA